MKKKKTWWKPIWRSVCCCSYTLIFVTFSTLNQYHFCFLSTGVNCLFSIYSQNIFQRCLRLGTFIQHPLSLAFIFILDRLHMEPGWPSHKCPARAIKRQPICSAADWSVENPEQLVTSVRPGAVDRVAGAMRWYARDCRSLQIYISTVWMNNSERAEVR